MFRKKLDIDQMSAEEMEAFLSRTMKRLLWLNVLWILFVIAMIFWSKVIGVILLIITVIKYIFDYYDIEAQSYYHGFLSHITVKKHDQTKDD